MESVRVLCQVSELLRIFLIQNLLWCAQSLLTDIPKRTKQGAWWELLRVGNA
jgi:hypothetical protein